MSDLSDTTSTQALDLMDGPIIVIDDDPDMLLSLELLLSKRFPEKEIYATDLGQRGIDWLETTQPSFIITDLALPDLDGIHVVLKAVINYPETPIIVMSGSIDMENYRSSSQHLPNICYLEKPFKGSDLIKRMEEVFKSKPDSHINGLNLINILQLVSEEVDYSHLEIISDEGKGVITIENKKILFAATEITAGKKALVELMGWERIDVSIYYRRRTHRININEPLSALLLEICQQSDEKGSSKRA